MTQTRPRRDAADASLVERLARDTSLADGLDPVAAPGSRARTTTLVTGATGFFGAALVDALLRAGDGDVLCLVRGADEATARDRLAAGLDRHGYPAAAGNSRIRAVAGDIAAFRLGLAARRRDELREGVGRIVHAAANVNGSLPYASLRADTVLGTAAMLQLAAESGATFHHVSTTAAVPTATADRGDCLDSGRDGSPVPLHGLANGYAQSKWVAERLVDAARQRGLRARTYRLGALAGHRRTALSNERDFRWIFVRACLELRAAPSLPGDLCWVPVDVAADAVAVLSRTGVVGVDDTLQVAASTGIRWAKVFSWLRQAGQRLDVVEADLWWLLLRDRLPGGSPGLTAMAAFAPALPSANPRPDDGTWAALAAHGVTQEPFDRRLLLRCLAPPAGSGSKKDPT